MDTAEQRTRRSDATRFAWLADRVVDSHRVPESDRRTSIDRAEEFEIDGVRVSVVTKDDLIGLKRRAAADVARRRSKALRDQADVELLLGDVPEPDEGW